MCIVIVMCLVVVITVILCALCGQEAQLVSVPVRYEGSGHRIKLCWLQKWHSGQSQDVWVLDDVIVLPMLPSAFSPDADRTVQMSVNLQCGPSADPSR